jgi:NAD(P)-dependent dehydrogenase (short-subunit alcohol dehydrogenase family)
MPDRIGLDGKVAVVTGAAGVIGTATMRLLAERGARIVAVDRKAADLQSAIKDLPASAQALAVPADVTGEDEVADYVRAAVDRFGSIDVFYNNAGIEGDVAPITKYSLEMFRKVIDVNVVGVFLGMKHVLPVMLKQPTASQHKDAEASIRLVSQGKSGVQHMSVTAQTSTRRQDAASHAFPERRRRQRYRMGRTEPGGLRREIDRQDRDGVNPTAYPGRALLLG